MESDRPIADALKNLNFVLKEADSKKKIKDAYADWANLYDSDMILINYTNPDSAVTVLLEYLVQSEDVKVVDLGCGTGEVGKRLRGRGFKGILHGLDGSQEMLDVASKKKIYDDIFAEFLIPGKPIRAAPGVLYNAAVSVGTITSNHVSPEILPDIMNKVTKNGLIVISVSDAAYNVDVIKLMNKTVEQLKESNQLKEIEIRRSQSLFNCDNKDAVLQCGLDPKDFEKSASVLIYCLQKKMRKMFLSICMTSINQLNVKSILAFVDMQNNLL